MSAALRLRLALLALSAGLCAEALAVQPIQARIGDPVLGLTPTELARFEAGKLEYSRILGAIDGLGPIMNDHSCASCHARPRVGGAGDKKVTRFGKAAVGPTPFDPLANLGGSLLQIEFIAPGCQELVPAQANVTAQRMTTSTAGLGLVEAIPDGDISGREVHPPTGVSGRAHMVQPLEDLAGPLRVGRFGWKAQVATVLSFSGDASLNELGLTNRLVTQENAPNGDPDVLALCDTVPDPEDGPGVGGLHAIDRQTHFQRYLAPPPQTPFDGMTGEKHFKDVGCTSCHVMKPYLTKPVAEAALSGKSIRPYSDFLLHDVGLTLGDGIVQGAASETELRTPPLWGLRFRAQTALLHDGRATGGTPAENLRAAIAAHGGEAAASRDAFATLRVAKQDRLIDFLLSLGRPEFDYEGDNDIDQLDWFFLQADGRFSGPGPLFGPNSPAAIADFDRDGDFDLQDFAALQRAATGEEVGLTEAEQEARVHRAKALGAPFFRPEWGAARADEPEQDTTRR